MTKRRLATGLCAALVSGLCSVGCGTFQQGHRTPGPAIYGGIRLDVAILSNEYTPDGSDAMAVLDLLFMGSLAFDTVFLPVSIPNELYQVIFAGDWIDVEAPLYWDKPPPKYAVYSAPPEEPVPGASNRRRVPDDAGL